MSAFQSGQILTLPYRNNQSMRVIVIDPNGQENGRPTLGMGFGMTEENLGLPKSTLSRWTEELAPVADNKGDTLDALAGEGFGVLQSTQCNTESQVNQDAPLKALKSPSGSTYRVLQILDETGNNQLVIEGCDWVDLACDVLEKPGKVKQATLNKLNTFVRWLAKKGFYATVYAQILGAYTRADDNALGDRIERLEAENLTLKTALYELECEHALLEHSHDRQQYLVDELQRDMAWHRSNSWRGRDH
jgi:hypothetical protein